MVAPHSVKRFVAGLVILLVTTAGPAAAAMHPVHLKIIGDDGQVWRIEGVRADGVTYLPMKPLARVLAARTHWLPVSRRVRMELEGHRLEVTLKRAEISVDGRRLRLRRAVRAGTEDYLIPVDALLLPAVTGAIGRAVVWNEAGASAGYGGTLRFISKPQAGAPRFYSYPTETRLTIPLAAGPATTPPALDVRRSGRQVILRLNAEGPRKPETVAVQDEVIGAVVVSRDGNRTRVVVDLGPRAGSFLIRPAAAGLVSLVVSKAAGAGRGEAEPAAASPEAAEPAAARDGLAAPSGSPVRAWGKGQVLVVDPGHGGEDSGALGLNGTREKDINLDIARELARLLRVEYGAKVWLTRTDDRFIPLSERTALANRVRADIFISVHANAAPSADRRGFEIYFLSEAASDAAAQKVANQENSVLALERGRGNGKGGLAGVLAGLMVNRFMNESSELCSLINGEVRRRLSAHSEGVKQAGFYVLKGAQMPAVLVEAGYLTHADDEARLNSRRYRQRLADAIYQGLVRFSERKSKGAAVDN